VVGNPGALEAVDTATNVSYPVTNWYLVAPLNETPVMEWNPEPPDRTCYRIGLTAANIFSQATGLALTGDPCCLVRSMIGHTSGAPAPVYSGGKTNLIDANDVYNRNSIQEVVCP